GIMIFVICVAIFSSGFALVYWISTRIRHVLYIASVWVLAEWLLHWASKGMPWFLFHIGNALSANLYAIQSASITAVYGMTFIVVCVHWLLARPILARKWKLFFLPAGVFLSYMAFGWILLNVFEKDQPTAKGFTVAILSENISPDIQWDQNNGDHLVQQL